MELIVRFEDSLSFKFELEFPSMNPPVYAAIMKMRAKLAVVVPIGSIVSFFIYVNIKDEKIMEEVEEAQPPVHQTRTLRRRKLNVQSTLNAFEQRIRALSQTKLMELENSWLSSYELWDTVAETSMTEEYAARRGTDLENNVFRLFHIARDRGVNVLGVTSERQCAGEYVAEIPTPGGRSVSKIIYAGKNNSFTGRKAGIWSILPRDKRYD